MSDLAQEQPFLPQEAGLGRTRPGKQAKIALQTRIEEGRSGNRPEHVHVGQMPAGAQLQMAKGPGH